jgi:hypothetical protein
MVVSRDILPSIQPTATHGSGGSVFYFALPTV